MNSERINPVNRQAIVIIHGIGEQYPMGTLRGFVEALLQEKGKEEQSFVTRWLLKFWLVKSLLKIAHICIGQRKEDKQEQGQKQKKKGVPRYYSEPDRISDSFELRRIMLRSEYDLRLMSVASSDGLVNEGCNLVIVARVGTDLHIRIFDASGEKVVDKAENELDNSGTTLKNLKEQLNSLLKKSSLSWEEKQKIIRAARSVAGDTLWPETTDFYEYYWAHRMSGTRWSHIGRWLKRILCRSWEDVKKPEQHKRLKTLYIGAWLIISL